MTLSPEPPGIFRVGLAPTGPTEPVGRSAAATPAVGKAASVLEVRPRRALSSATASITLPSVDPGVAAEVSRSIGRTDQRCRRLARIA